MKSASTKAVPLRRQRFARGAEEERAGDAEHRRDEHGDAAEAGDGTVVEMAGVVRRIEQVPALRATDDQRGDDRRQRSRR